MVVIWKLFCATVRSRASNLDRQGHFEISRYCHKLKILPAELGSMSIKRQQKKMSMFILNIQNYGSNIVFQQSKNYFADRDGSVRSYVGNAVGTSKKLARS
jgi:hypothetical protein